MKRFKFLGFGSKGTNFGEGEFTIGNIYTVIKVDLPGGDRYPSVRAIDDNGLKMWEELYAFEEVTNHDTE